MLRVPEFEPDGRHLPVIKRHSVDKIRLHNYYASVFTTAMHKMWPNLVYIGLYSGAGAAELSDTGETIQTSALSALTQAIPFTQYIFVDEDVACIQALHGRAEEVGMYNRVTLVHSKVNDSLAEIRSSIPDYRTEGGVLTFCFVDPFRIDLDFSVIRGLSDLRIDFLIMIPLGYDVRRNRADYLDRPEAQERMAKFIDDPHWDIEWFERGLPDSEFQRFIHTKLNEAMKDLGFIEQEFRDARDVKVAGMEVYLYSLALYSKHDRGRDFWRQSVKGTSEQWDLGL